MPEPFPIELPIYLAFLLGSIALSVIVLLYFLYFRKINIQMNLELIKKQHRNLMIFGVILFIYNLACLLVVVIVDFYSQNNSADQQNIYSFFDTFGLAFILFTLVGLLIIIIKPIVYRKEVNKIQTDSSEAIYAH